MTKRNLLLVSLFLVFGLVASASSALAQTAWQASANTNPGGRCQGLTEATGQIGLQSQSTGTINSSSYFKIYYTAPVAGLGTVYLKCSGGGVGWVNGCAPTGGSGAFGFITATLNPTAIGGYAPNEILTLTFNTNVVVWPATGGSGPGNALIDISVRLNATVACASPATGYVTIAIQAFSPAANMTLQNQPNPNIVLNVNPDPALSVGLPGSPSPGLGVYCREDERYKCEISQTAYVLLCLGVLKGNQQYERYFTVNVGEKFVYALTSMSWEDTLDTGSSSPGFVTNPTLITVVLNNIPANFGVSAGEPIPCTEVTTGEPGSCYGVGALDAELSGKDSYWNSTGLNTGTATFEYCVGNNDAGSPENLNLPFKFYSKGPIGTSALPCVTLSIYKNPEVPPATTAIPRFVSVNEGTVNVICFNNCETNLLYPLVLNAGPWDTDLAVSNVTMDPLGILGSNIATVTAGAGSTYYPGPPDLLLEAGSATPQSGNCYNFFYAGGGLVDSWTMGPIAAGSTMAYDLAGSRPKTAGYTGYIWTKCEFSQAYGYAAIDYSLGVSAGIYANYLAINIPDPEWSPRDLNGDGMGENTLTPVNLARRLEKRLSGLYGH